MQLFVSRFAEDPFFVLAWMLVIVFSICVHECAHAWMALRQGDETAYEAGHLSLNPLIQMGWNSLLMLALFGFAWGSVPVDERRMRSSFSPAWVALAGPLANLVLAVIFAGLLVALSWLPGPGAPLVERFFHLAVLANGVLCIFNLLPIPLFDGWAIGATFLPLLRRVPPAHAQSLSWLFFAAVWMTPLGGIIWQVGATLAYGLIQGWTWVSGLVMTS
jgi:Zn-dependent protease